MKEIKLLSVAIILATSGFSSHSVAQSGGGGLAKLTFGPCDRGGFEFFDPPSGELEKNGIEVSTEIGSPAFFDVRFALEPTIGGPRFDPIEIFPSTGNGFPFPSGRFNSGTRVLEADCVIAGADTVRASFMLDSDNTLVLDQVAEVSDPWRHPDWEFEMVPPSASQLEAWGWEKGDVTLYFKPANQKKSKNQGVSQLDPKIN